MKLLASVLLLASAAVASELEGYFQHHHQAPKVHVEQPKVVHILKQIPPPKPFVTSFNIYKTTHVGHGPHGLGHHHGGHGIGHIGGHGIGHIGGHGIGHIGGHGIGHIGGHGGFNGGHGGYELHGGLGHHGGLHGGLELGGHGIHGLGGHGLGLHGGHGGHY